MIRLTPNLIYNDIDSVRNDLNNKVSDLKSAIAYITGNGEYEGWKNPKQYIKLDGTTADVTDILTSSGNCQCIIISASEGYVFTISCTGGAASRAYGFVAGNGDILEVAGVTQTLTKKVVIAPANTAYLVVNDTTYAGHVYSGIIVDKRVTNIENGIGNISQIIPNVIGYINTSGTSVSLTPTENSSYRNIILPCAEGDAFTVTATSGNSALPYVFINSSDENKILEKAKSAELTGEIIIAPEGTTNVVFNCNVSYSYEFYHGFRTINKTISDIINRTKANENSIIGINSAIGNYDEVVLNESGYISTNGLSTELIPTTSSAFKHTVISCSEGEVFTIKGAAGSSALPYSFIDEYGVFLEKAKKDRYDTETFIVAPKKTNKAIFNVSVYYTGAKFVHGFKTLNDISADFFTDMNIRDIRKTSIFRTFENIVCIGDSLTYSQVYNAAGITRQAFVPYPESVEKITGTPTTYYATPGYSCEQWWNQYNSNITGSNKLYVVYLGTNDDSTMTDTVATDCVGDDPSQYADSPCGYYGRIIRTIQITRSRCVLIKIGLGSAGDNVNAAIVSLGERFGVPVIENPQYILADNYYHYGDLDTTYKNTVHLNDLGYERFAEYVVDTINELPLSVKYALMPKGT